MEAIASMQTRNTIELNLLMTRIQKKVFMLTTEWKSVERTSKIQSCTFILHRASSECFDKSMVKVKNSLLGFLRPKDTIIAVLWISSNEIGEEIIIEALILWEL